MTSTEVIKNKIAGLEDDYQHYTMVDKDKVKAHFIKIDIEEHQQILQDLERLEELEKENQEWIKLYNLITEGNWNLKNENQKLKKAIHKAVELLSVDGKGTKQEVKKLLSEVLGE